MQKKTEGFSEQRFEFSLLHLGRMNSPLVRDRKTLEQGKHDFYQIMERRGTESGPQSSRTFSFTMRGVVSTFRTDRIVIYPSDQVTKRKVTEIAPGVWHSDSSDKDFLEEELEWRYALSLLVVDQSASTWMTAFNEAGKVILGRTAAEMELLRQRDPSKWKSVLDDSCFKPLLLEVVVKKQSFRGEDHVRYVLNKAKVIDFSAEALVLLLEIRQLQEDESEGM